MRSQRLRLVFFPLLLSALLLLVLLTLGRGPVQAVRAALTLQSDLFASPGGSGWLCTAAQPCDLSTALSQATDGDTLYLAGGTYTGTGGAVITLTHSITLYGGWDGSATTPPLRDPDGFPSTLDGENQRRVVYVGAGAPVLDGVAITRGYSDDSGGGIYTLWAGLTLRHSDVVSNGSDRDGGGVFVNGGSALIQDNQILSNTAIWAGGLRLINDADVTLEGNEIRGNVAAIAGGGVYVDCCGGSLAHVERNLIVANEGGPRGGGLQVQATRAQVVNNILADNQATLGAGIYLEGGASYPATVSLTHNTLAGGPAGGEGLALAQYVTATLTNSIIAGYTNGVTVTTPGTSHLSADHNLFWNARDALTGSLALVEDPALDGSYHLTPGSPARDAGRDAGVYVDYDGDTRPIGGYDIGADEYLQPGAITGRVTDEQNHPLGGIMVNAGDRDAVLDCGGTPLQAETQSDGSYQIDVPPGTYLVFANTHEQAGGYVPEAYADVNSWSAIGAATPISVAGGGAAGGVDLSLPAGYTVSGRLVDAQGGPVGGAGGYIADPVQAISFGCALGFGTAPSGTFRINVPPGTYDLDFGKGDVGHRVRAGLVVTGDLNLGDVLFATVPESGPVFDPHVLEAGYQVQTVVPGGPNTPSDVAVLPGGGLYLAAIRSWTVYQVGDGGTLTPTAPVGVYALDAGADGNLYGYFFPGNPGTVVRISPSGTVTEVGTVPGTACESTLAAAPDLDLWIGYNSCGGTGFGDSRLYRMTPAGQLFTVTTGLPFGIGGLDFDSSGQLYMTLGDALYRVNTSDGSRTQLATLPGGGASHGLVVDPAGGFYVSSGDDSTTDVVYRVTAEGAVSVFATLPGGCLQGLDRLPDGDLVGTMRCTGALYRIGPGGSVAALLAGNGMATPQTMAFSPAGELFVTNDESGRVVRIANGRGEPFAELVTYISPLADLAFEPSGDFFFSEGAPGFPSRLVRVSPQGAVTEFTRDVNVPSGLAFAPDGTLYVAENGSGQVASVSAGGQVTPLVAGLTHPESLAAGDAGELYVTAFDPAVAPADERSNTIWKIAPDGSRTPFARVEATELAFLPNGDLLVSGPVAGQSGVLRVAANGSVTPFASGFLSAVGLAFDLSGDLYVSDDWHNSITRISGFPQGTLQGAVKDARTGQPIPAAGLSIVSAYPLVVGGRVDAGGSGAFRAAVAPRAYTVTASAPGYQSATQTAAVQAGATVTLTFELTPGNQVYLPLVLRNG